MKEPTPIRRDTSQGVTGGTADGRVLRDEVDPQPKIPRDVAGLIPPFDLPAESCVLGKMMLSIDWLGAALDRLKADDFYAPAHRQIFGAILDLVLNGRAPDRNTVRAWLADHDKLRGVGGDDYLAKLVLSPGIGSTTATIERVLETSLIRKAGAAAHQIAAEHYHCVGNPRGWIESSARAFADLAAAASATVGHEAAPEIADRVFEAMNAEINPSPERQAEERVRTGMHDLDRLMGPLKSGLCVIAAWAGVGKSSLAREWALRIAQRNAKKRGIVIVSLEMNADELILAMAYSIAGVDSSKHDTGRPLSADEAQGVSEAWGTLKRLPWLWIADQTMLAGKTPRHIEALVRRIQMNDAPRVGVEVGAAFVDYLQLCSPETQKNANREQEITSIAYGLHYAGLRLKVPMVALSQLNEDGKKRKDGRPCAEDARESKGIVQAAQRVVIVHNTHYLERRRKMQEERGSYEAPDEEEVELIVDKNRGGRTGIVGARFLPWCTRFDDLTVPEPQ